MKKTVDYRSALTITSNFHGRTKVLKHENVYIVYILSPLITTDFRISDGILKVVNAIMAFNNNNERQTFGPFQRRRTYRVETRGHDTILSY